ncbi:MAG TPA: hypothetical protein VE528_00785 [Thermoleophilaceae bacterium]|jgi:hypothetical protein|nr:hypothetical protein [Thermoleophilaceae bacterium]
MSERSASEDDPRRAKVDNPTEDELDLEGPNESAPGHEPADEAAEGGTAPPAEDA